MELKINKDDYFDGINRKFRLIEDDLDGDKTIDYV